MGVLREDLRRDLTANGAVLVGFADVLTADPEAKSLLPYPALTRLVSFAALMNPATAAAAIDGPGPDYEREVERLSSVIALLCHFTKAILHRYGYKAENVPVIGQDFDPMALPKVFSNERAAVDCDLGWIGKTGQFTCADYGMAVRLGTVFTDASFPVHPAASKSACGSCRNCVIACPAGASYDREWTAGMERSHVVNRHSCFRQMLQWKIDRHLNSNLCGICMASCPYTQRWLERCNHDPSGASQTNEEQI